MRIRFLIVGGVVIALLALVLYSKWFPEPNRITGFIEADEIRLGSRVGGRVAKVLVSEGQHVDKGTVLVELEPFDLLERKTELELLLAAREAEYQRFLTGFREEEKLQAKAKLEQLTAALELLQAGPRTQEIEAARGRLALAKAELKLAEQGLQRAKQLATSNAVSQQELDTAQESLQAAAAGLIVRQQELDLLESGAREQEIRQAAGRVEEAKQALQLMESGYRQEEIQQAAAARDAAQARVAAVERQMEELSIRSPIAGSIEALDLQPGDMVAPGAPVLSMLDRQAMWVRAYVPQSRVGIKVGQTIRLTVDSLPEEPFEGMISFVARQAEFTPSNVQTLDERSKQVYRIKIAVKNEGDRLRPGMMADVWLDQIGSHHE
ncbi:MAG: efflux RND transporter periplasmic adaptor subunit [Pirellulaceae bacterium]